ncbi:hypothetical protein [Amaricoccus sp. W119]|uniref:hypothetical protein n=1 Tax=Amaricoccus sp. W119 TaxID=3391833 RepID=UPI0039A66EDD
MFGHFRSRMAKRARYNRMVEEIMALSDREVQDTNGTRDEMLRTAYDIVYGA